MKPELAVTGAAGRMGKRIISLAIDEGCLRIIAAVERADHPDIGKDAGLVAAAGCIGVKLAPDYPPAADVMVDFSTPQATLDCLEYCRNHQVPLVIGTTGLGESPLEKIRTASIEIPILQSTNMSVGMNVLFSLAGELASLLGEDYDIEIVEAHHRFKKDAPSGSALSLAQNMAAATGRDWPGCLVTGRSGKEALRQKNTIGIHAVRAGDIVGEHSIIFGTCGETVTLSHTAHSRDTFARGALRAAWWLIGKKPGLYSMADVLGFK